jgi:hypothetical protein
MKNRFGQECNHGKSLVLACAVMEKEIRQFQNGSVDLKFFDFGLHRTPENMSHALQIEIDRVSEQDYEGIILGYGLCSNGIVGVIARRQRLIVPRVHDCITIFLGSHERHQDQTTKHPGTYYLTPGWIDKGESPISKYQSYAQSYDEETARWVLHEEMKHYTRIAFIKTRRYAIDSYRKIAKDNAEFLGIAYQELDGSSRLFRELVRGPWDGNFLVLKEGDSIHQEMLLEL